MLVVTRKPQQSLTLTTEHGEVITVQYLAVDGAQIRLGIDAPMSVVIERDDMISSKTKHKFKRTPKFLQDNDDDFGNR